MNHESVEAWAGGGPQSAKISGYALDCWSAGNVWTSPFYRQMVCLQRKDGNRLGLVVTLRSGNASCFGRDVNSTVWRIRRQKTYRHVLLSRSPRYSGDLKVGVKKLTQKNKTKRKKYAASSDDESRNAPAIPLLHVATGIILQLIVLVSPTERAAISADVEAYISLPARLIATWLSLAHCGWLALLAHGIWIKLCRGRTSDSRLIPDQVGHKVEKMEILFVSTWSSALLTTYLLRYYVKDGKTGQYGGKSCWLSHVIERVHALPCSSGHVSVASCITLTFENAVGFYWYVRKTQPWFPEGRT